MFVLPRLADYGEVWHEVKTLDARSLALLGLVTLINLATFAPPWMATLPGLGFWRAFVSTQASTASTYIAPGGAAVGIAASLVLLRKWGYRTSAAALAAALTGIWNQLAALGFPALALGLLTLTGGHNPLLKTVGLLALIGFVVSIVVFACALASSRLARAVGRRALRAAQLARTRSAPERGPLGRRDDRAVPRADGLMARRDAVRPDAGDGRRAALRLRRASDAPSRSA